MQYGVISNFNKVNKLYNFCIISGDGTFNITGFKTCTEDEVVNASKSLGLKLLNFSISKDNKIKEDSGSFTRFDERGVFVVLAEITNKAGKTLGYRVLESTTNTVVNKRTEELVKLEKSANRPVMQNGIVRNGSVSCYPLHQFPSIVIGDSIKKSKNKVKEVNKVKEETKPIKKPSSDKKEDSSIFSPAQKSEITTCRSRGINSKFIENPELTPEQMRVLWVSKSKGALSEYFAKPEYSVDVMKFYADRLLNKKSVESCKELLNHQELTVPQLVELYMCIVSGVDYDDLLDKDAYTISTERMMRENQLWENPVPISKQALDDDILRKAVGYVKSVRGY